MGKTVQTPAKKQAPGIKLMNEAAGGIKHLLGMDHLEDPLEMKSAPKDGILAGIRNFVADPSGRKRTNEAEETRKNPLKHMNYDDRKAAGDPDEVQNRLIGMMTGKEGSREWNPGD